MWTTLAWIAVGWTLIGVLAAVVIGRVAATADRAEGVDRPQGAERASRRSAPATGAALGGRGREVG